MLGNRYAIEWIQLLESKDILAPQLVADSGLEWSKVQSGEQRVRKTHFRKMLVTAQQRLNEQIGRAHV